MMRFRKDFNLKILSITVSCVVTLFTSTVYSVPTHNETLRLPIGEEDNTLVRMQDAFGDREKLLDLLWYKIIDDRTDNEEVKRVAMQLERFGYTIFTAKLGDDYGRIPGYDPGDYNVQSFVLDNAANNAALNEIGDFLKKEGVEESYSYARELYMNLAKYTERGVLLIRIVSRDSNIDAEMVSIDKSDYRGPLQEKDLNITDQERMERLMMNEGGYNLSHGDGAGMQILQTADDFKVEVVPDGGTRISLVKSMKNKTVAPQRDGNTSAIKYFTISIDQIRNNI